MRPGFVYILINPSLKGMVKIGRTSRSSERRASELSSATGVPTEYYVAYDEFFPDCHLAERLLHNHLAPFRVNKKREFFQRTA